MVSRSVPLKNRCLLVVREGGKGQGVGGLHAMQGGLASSRIRLRCESAQSRSASGSISTMRSISHL